MEWVGRSIKLWKIHARVNSLRLRKCKSLHLRLKVRESLKLRVSSFMYLYIKNNNERCCHIFSAFDNVNAKLYKLYDIRRLNVHVEVIVFYKYENNDHQFLCCFYFWWNMFILDWKPLWHVAAHQTVVKLSLFNHLVKFIKNPELASSIIICT